MSGSSCHLPVFASLRCQEAFFLLFARALAAAFVMSNNIPCSHEQLSAFIFRTKMSFAFWSKRTKNQDTITSIHNETLTRTSGAGKLTRLCSSYSVKAHQAHLNRRGNRLIFIDGASSSFAWQTMRPRTPLARCTFNTSCWLAAAVLDMKRGGMGLWRTRSKLRNPGCR